MGSLRSIHIGMAVLMVGDKQVFWHNNILMHTMVSSPQRLLRTGLSWRWMFFGPPSSWTQLDSTRGAVN